MNWKFQFRTEGQMIFAGKRRAFLPILLLVSFFTVAAAQDGVSFAGASRTRYLGNLGVLPDSREVIVEDFVNYHRHEIGRPKAGEAVGLDLRWRSDSISRSSEAVLQIGLSTALKNDKSQLRPINLALVIDKSGSMAASDKMSRVKASLLTLVSQLRPSDRLSIVVFDSEAHTLMASQELQDKGSVKNLIRSIEPGSSTNIHAGLMLGYREAQKQYRKNWTNRVILLTDGIANQGVTSPAQIAKESFQFNDKGIDLSTIGVGQDLNKDLLRELAKSGRGLFHFVADSQDIEKAFVNEVQSLLSPVATEPNLTIEFGPGLDLQQVYGYEPKLAQGNVQIKLDNMNSGMTEVVLLRFKASEANGFKLPVRVRLSYYDLEREKEIIKTLSTSIGAYSDSKAAAFEDESVDKNFTIAELAQSIHDMAESCEKSRFLQAERNLKKSLALASQRYPNLTDPDVKRTYDIAQKYYEALHQDNRARGEAEAVEEPATKGDNLIFNGDFSLGNAGFTCDLPYIAPSPNCLWGGYYTVASSFDSPYQLHTNVPAQPYAAPIGGQVLFMNSGGTKPFTPWAAEVKCKPRTKYRIRFQEIGLSGGPEWTNSYEIRVNGARSEPQIGGVFKFVEISYEWSSGQSSSARVSVVRLPHARGGGIIGIANVQMFEVK